MGSSFQITGQLIIRSSTANIRQITSGIQRQLNSINANVNVKVPTNLNNQLGSIVSQISALNNNLTSVGKNSALTRAAGSAGKVVKPLKEAASTAELMGISIGEAARKFTAFSIAASALIGVVASIRQGVSAAVDFQHELVRLEQISGGSNESIAGISDEVSRLSRTLGVSSKELIGVAGTLRQAGLSAEDTRVALRGIAESDLAPTFKDIQNTVEGAIVAMQSFGLRSKELYGLLGSINRVSADFAVESDDIVHALRRSGGAFKAAGGSINELIALFTSVRSTTRESAETIASGFNTIFARLQRPEAVDQLRLMGINLRFTANEAKAFGKTENEFVGPYEAIRRLNTALSSVPPASQEYAAIVELIGGFRQVSKVVPLLQQFNTTDKAFQSALAGTNSLTQSTLIAQKSLTVQVSQLGEQFLELFRVLGSNKELQSFLSTVLSVTSAVVKMAKVVEPLVPLLASLAAVKIASVVGLATQSTKFFPGFAKGLTGAKRTGFASGGVVPGVGNSDSVRANLTPGEFVIRKKSAKAIGYDALSRMNRGGKVQRFEVGGTAKQRDSWDWDSNDDDFSLLSAYGTDNERERLRRQRKMVAKLKTSKMSMADAAKRHYSVGGDVEPLRFAEGTKDKTGVPNKAYVFDFDDVLSRISARDKKKINDLKLNKEYKKAFEHGYGNPDVIARSIPTVLTKLAARRSQEGHDVHILTARSAGPDDSIVQAIQSFAEGQGIKLKSVIATGGVRERIPNPLTGRTRLANVAERKNLALARLSSNYSGIKFYDDKQENVLGAKSVEGVKARTVRPSRVGELAKIKKGPKGSGDTVVVKAPGGSVAMLVTDKSATEHRDTFQLPVQSLKGDAKATFDKDLSTLIFSGALSKSEAANIKALSVPITVQPVNRNVKEKTKSLLEKSVLSTLETTARTLDKPSANVELSSNDIQETLKVAIGADGLGRFFEGTLQLIARRLGSKGLGKTGATFDFAPVDTEGFTRLFGPKVQGLYGDAKLTDNIHSRASITAKAVRQFGFTKGASVQHHNLSDEYVDESGKPVSFKRDTRFGKAGQKFSKLDYIRIRELEGQRYARGGKVNSTPLREFNDGGAAGTDTVPALLTPGEFVVRREAAQRIGYNNLHRMNRYARGGYVSHAKRGRKFYKDQLAEGNKPEIFDKELASHIPKGSIQIGEGAEARVFLSPKGSVIRLGDPNVSRPKSSLVLQARKTKIVGEHKIEHLPFVPSLDDTFDTTGRDLEVSRKNAIKKTELRNLYDQTLLKKGLIPEDTDPKNLGIYRNKLLAIDPDVFRKPGGYADGGIVQTKAGPAKRARSGKLFLLEDLGVSGGRLQPKGSIGQRTRLRRIEVDPDTETLSAKAKFYAKHRNARFLKRMATGGEVSFADRFRQLFPILSRGKIFNVDALTAERHLAGEKVDLPFGADAGAVKSTRAEVTKRLNRVKEFKKTGPGLDKDGTLRVPFGRDELAMVGRGNVGDAGPNVLSRPLSALSSKIRKGTVDSLKGFGIKKVAARFTRHVISNQATKDFENSIYQPVNNAIVGAFKSRFSDAKGDYSFSRDDLATMEGVLFQKYIQGVSKTRLSKSSGANDLFDFPGGIKSSDNFNKIVLPSPINPKALADAKLSVAQADTTDSFLGKYLNFRGEILPNLIRGERPQVKTRGRDANLTTNFSLLKKIEGRIGEATADQLKYKNDPASKDAYEAALDRTIALKRYYQKVREENLREFQARRKAETPFARGGKVGGVITNDKELYQKSLDDLGGSGLDFSNVDLSKVLRKAIFSKRIKYGKDKSSPAGIFTGNKKSVVVNRQGENTSNVFGHELFHAIDRAEGSGKSIYGSQIPGHPFQESAELAHSFITSGGEAAESTFFPHIKRYGNGPTAYNHEKLAHGINYVVGRKGKGVNQDSSDFDEQKYKDYHEHLKNKVLPYIKERYGFATGGSIGTDSVPALLTPGEFVFTRPAAQRIGYDNLHRMNRYAEGGRVEPLRFAGGTGRRGVPRRKTPISSVFSDKFGGDPNIAGFQTDPVSGENIPLSAEELKNIIRSEMGPPDPRIEAGISRRNVNQPPITYPGKDNKSQGLSSSDPIVNILNKILTEIKGGVKISRSEKTGTGRTKSPTPSSPAEDGEAKVGLGKRLQGLGSFGAVIAAQYLPQLAENFTGTADKPTDFGKRKEITGLTNFSNFEVLQAGSGALAGGATGAAIGGTLLPGLGHAIGGATGAILGFIGSVQDAGQALRNAKFDKESKRLSSAISRATADANPLSSDTIGDIRSGLQSTLREANQAKDKDLFLAEHVNSSEIAQLSDKILRLADIKTSDRTNQPEQIRKFLEAGGGVGKDIVNVLSQLPENRDQSLNQILKPLLDQGQRLAIEKERSESIEKFSKATEIQTRLFGRLSDALTTASSSLALLDDRANATLSLAEGQLTPQPLRQRTLAAENFGTGINVGEVNKSIDFITEPLRGFGGRLDENFNRTAKSVNVALDLLPDTLLRVVKGGVTAEGFNQKVGDALAQSIGAQHFDFNFEPAVLDQFKRAFATFDLPDLLKQISVDINGVTDDLIKRSFPNLAQAIQTGAKQIEDAFAAYQVGLSKFQELGTKIGESRDKISGLQTEGLAEQRKILARRTGFVSNNTLTPTEGLRPFVQTQERLTGVRGEAAFNPEAIASQLRNVIGQIGSVQAKQRSVGFEEGKKFELELSNLGSSASKLNQALQRLASPVEQNAILQERLNAINAEEAQRLSLAEEFVRASPADRFKLDRSANLAGGVVGGQIDFRLLNTEFQNAVLDFTHKVEDIRTPVLKGLTGREFREALLRNLVPDKARLPGGKEGERANLENRIVDNVNRAIQAQEALTGIMQNQQRDFFSSLQANQQTFLDNYAKITLNAEKRDLQNKVSGAGAVRQTTLNKVESAEKIRGVGFDDLNKARSFITSPAFKDISEQTTRQKSLQEDRKNLTANAAPLVGAKEFFDTQQLRSTLTRVNQTKVVDVPKGVDRESFFKEFLGAKPERGVQRSSVTDITKIQPLLDTIRTNLNIDKRVPNLPETEKTRIVDSVKKALEGGTKFSPDTLNQFIGREITTSIDSVLKTLSDSIQANKKDITARTGVGEGTIDKSIDQLDKVQEALKVLEGIPTFDALDTQVTSTTQAFSELELQLRSFELNQSPDKSAFTKDLALKNLQKQIIPRPFGSIGLAGGGDVFVPRGTDTIPAMLSPGEFVVNSHSARKNKGLLKEINRSKTSYLATGGYLRKKDDEIPLSGLNKSNLPFGEYIQDDQDVKRGISTLSSETDQLSSGISAHRADIASFRNEGLQEYKVLSEKVRGIHESYKGMLGGFDPAVKNINETKDRFIQESKANELISLAKVEYINKSRRKAELAGKFRTPASFFEAAPSNIIGGSTDLRSNIPAETTKPNTNVFPAERQSRNFAIPDYTAVANRIKARKIGKSQISPSGFGPEVFSFDNQLSGFDPANAAQIEEKKYSRLFALRHPNAARSRRPQPTFPNQFGVPNIQGLQPEGQRGNIDDFTKTKNKRVVNDTLLPSQDIRDIRSRLIKKRRGGAKARRFAEGGAVGTDVVPAMLSPGEFIVSAGATSANLDLLESLNSRRPIYRARGGKVSPTGVRSSGEAGTWELSAESRRALDLFNGVFTQTSGNLIQSLNGFGESINRLNNFVTGLQNLINPLTVASQNLQTLGQTFGQFNTAATNLSTGMAMFNTLAKPLTTAIEALSRIPTNFTHTINGTNVVNVVVSTPDLTSAFKEEFSKKIINEAVAQLTQQLLSGKIAPPN